MRHNPCILIGGDLHESKIKEFIELLPKNVREQLKKGLTFKDYVEHSLLTDKNDISFWGGYDGTLVLEYHNIPSYLREFCMENDLSYVLPNATGWWTKGCPRGKQQQALDEILSYDIEDFIKLSEKYDGIDKAPQGINSEDDTEKKLVMHILDTNVADKFENLKWLLISAMNKVPKIPPFRIIK